MTDRSPEMFVYGWLECNLGNDDFQKPVEIIISTSPTQNTLNIEKQETIKTASVYNLLGEKVTVNQISTDSIDVSDLATGILKY